MPDSYQLIGSLWQRPQALRAGLFEHGRASPEGLPGSMVLSSPFVQVNSPSIYLATGHAHVVPAWQFSTNADQVTRLSYKRIATILSVSTGLRMFGLHLPVSSGDVALLMYAGSTTQHKHHLMSCY